MATGMRQLLRGLTKIVGSPASNLLQPLRPSLLAQRSVHVTCSLNKELRQGKEKIRVGRDHDKMQAIDLAAESIAPSKGIFPDETTPHEEFDGIPFAQLPIVNMKSMKNNTTFNLTNAEGRPLLIHSSGREGFKGCKRGTGPAAQQAAITFATRARRMGMRTVKVRIQGFGLGRMNGLMGLSMGGVQVVSVTDTTRVSPNPPRPRGPKSL